MSYPKHLIKVNSRYYYKIKVPTDLSFMDCSMPVMNGYEATAIIRDQTSKVRNHTIPIIALTANAQREDRDKCLAVGMNAYLSKPILISDLLAKVEKCSAIEPTIINCASE